MLNAIGAICPQYWLVPKVETTFSGPLVIIQAHFGHPKAWGTSTVNGPLLNLIIFYEQCFLKLTMHNHAQSAMLPPHDCNLTTHLWERIGSNVILNHHMFEWFKLVKLCMVMVLGNMEDERTFSNMAFIKKKLQNCLTTHLNFVVWMYAQKFNDLKKCFFYLVIHD